MSVTESSGRLPTVQRTLRAVGQGETRPVVRRRRSVSRLAVAIVALDVVAVVAVLATVWRAGAALEGWSVLAGGLLILARAGKHLYRRRLRLSWIDDVPRSLTALAIAIGATVLGSLLVGGGQAPLAYVAWLVVLMWAGAEMGRAAAVHLARVKRRHARQGDRTLLLGTGETARDLAVMMHEHPEFGLQPVGFVDLVPVDMPHGLPQRLYRGELGDVIRRARASTVVIADPAAPESMTIDSAITAHQTGCAVLLLPRMFELYRDGLDVERLRSYPLVRLPGDPTLRPAWLAKRLSDMVLAIVAMVVVAPVLLACALAVLIESGRPALYAQERVGLGERHFRLYKFRSMRPSTDGESTWSVAGDPRIGPVGRVLRRTSLDELPQLWNVLRGDMSLVGPRPERPGFVARFTEEHERYWARHRVPAGLTGLAQVNGLRGNTSITDRARYDNYYIATWSPWLDVKVLLLTARELVRRGEH